VLRAPTLEELVSKAESFQPTVVYLRGPYAGQHDRVRGPLGPLSLSGKPRGCEQHAARVVHTFLACHILGPAEDCATTFHQRLFPGCHGLYQQPLQVV
jgi:hypothetical protein